MSRVSAISSSDHLKRRKRLFAFNRRHQDKAFRFLKYSLCYWKRQNLFSVGRGIFGSKIFQK